MVFVAHKYMPDQIPVEELRATFAARHHTLRYLGKSLRDQAHARTLTSYLITGPRGSGKTTLIRMLCLKLERNRALREAWLPVRFPEELPTVTSLRDLLAKALEVLADADVPGARDWHQRVEEQEDEAQAQDIAIAGLQWLAREEKRRLILFVENLDLVFDRGLTAATQATLRRLLMTEPFMMLIGSAVQPFPELQSYDRAFFNYFCPVELEPLSEKQAYRILKRRAKWDGNNDFERIHREHGPKIRAISLLTGGNPRLLLMLYEILMRQDIQSAVQALRKLVDELTPLLKDIVEHQLTKQQVKVIDALMQLDGNATPSQIAGKSRLSLNIVTTQLKRLGQARIVAVTGGGKGRPAWYSIRDRLFYTWYQMRYLQPGRRRIELFVQVLQIWFEADERMQLLRHLSDTSVGDDNATACVETAEYLAASLVKTQYEESARRIAIKAYLRAGQPDSAVGLFAEFEGKSSAQSGASRDYVTLARWLRDHGDFQEALGLARRSTEEDPRNTDLRFEYAITLLLSARYIEAISCVDQLVACPDLSPEEKAWALGLRGAAKGAQGDVAGAIADQTAVIEIQDAPNNLVALALSMRGQAKGMQGDRAGEIVDYTAVIQLEGAPSAEVGGALYNRGMARGIQGDTAGEIADYTAVIELEGASPADVAEALCNRGVIKARQGATTEAIADYTAAIELKGAPCDLLATALNNRAAAKEKQGDASGAIADCTAVIELEGAPRDEVAKALNNRGAAKEGEGDAAGAIADYTAVIELEGAPCDLMATALNNRGLTKGKQGDITGEIADYTAVVGLEGAPPYQVAMALYNRGVTKGIRQGDAIGAMLDYTAVIELEDAPRDVMARALHNCGVTKGKQGDISGAIADYTGVMSLKGAPGDVIAGALYSRGLAKARQGDTGEAIADYTDVIGFEGAPREMVGSALYSRGAARGTQGDKEGALADFIAVMRMPEALPRDHILAGMVAARDALSEANESAAKKVVAALREWLAGFNGEERAQYIVDCLVALTELEARDAWLYAFAELLKGQPEEILKELAFLRPVAEVLESGDLSKLDAIAPEQRDFALQVLDKLGVRPAAGGEGNLDADS
jgi:tetratricopeptide (TPR) repeat protein